MISDPDGVAPGDTVRPFYDHIGLEVDPRTDEAVVRLEQHAAVNNSRGAVHGGALATLLDAALSRAVRIGCQTTSTATVTLTVNFLRPGAGKLRAYGRVIHASKNLAVAEGQVLDESGSPVAAATGTFRIFR